MGSSPTIQQYVGCSSAGRAQVGEQIHPVYINTLDQHPGYFCIMTIQAKLANRTAESGVVYGVSSANNDVAVPLKVTTNGSLANGSRTYNFSAAARAVVNSTPVLIDLTNVLTSSREIMLVSNVGCTVEFGNSSVVVASTDLAALFLPANLPFHLTIPQSQTHCSVVRDTSDGFIRIIPSA